MTDRPNIQNLLRPREQYSTHELSAYAREILTHGYPAERRPYSRRLTTNWETDEHRVDMVCENLEEESPTYQLNVRSKVSSGFEEFIYRINANWTYVDYWGIGADDGRNYRIHHSNPHVLTVEVMRILRERPAQHPEEPQNNEYTERVFRGIMANLAIDTVIDDELVDLWQFVGQTEPTEENQQAIDTVLAQGIEVGDDLFFPYVRSMRTVSEELGSRVNELSSSRQIEP